MPFTVMRPSPATEAEFELLERALKNVMVGDSAGPLVSTNRPGVALSSAPAARATGSAWIMSVFITISRLVFCTSTTGDAPVTVTVSSMAPTRISIGIVAVCVPDSSTASRLTVANPGSVKVNAYVPDFRSMMRYWPVPSVTAARVFSISAELAASTVTPGSTAPDASRTVPVTDACANRGAGSSRKTTSARHVVAVRIGRVSL